MTTSQSQSPDDGRAQVPGWAAVEQTDEFGRPDDDDLEESPEAGAAPPPELEPEPPAPSGGEPRRRPAGDLYPGIAPY